MKTVVTYSFSQLEPYINWVYFYHAWSLNGKPECERQRMKAEALDTLRQTDDRFKARAIIGLYLLSRYSDASTSPCCASNIPPKDATTRCVSLTLCGLQAMASPTI